jgi:F5/8 type C domain
MSLPQALEKITSTTTRSMLGLPQPLEKVMIINHSQQRRRKPRTAFRLLRSAGPLVVACSLYTSAWGSTTVYVAQSSGNDQNNGATPQTAVKSVARGLALAAAGTEVQIATGLYDEQLPPIPQNVTLSGGWDPSFDPGKRTLLTAESLRTLKAGSAKCAVQQGAGLTCLTNSNGDRVVTLRSPGGQALRQLVVLGPDLSSKNDGSSSFGVIVDGASGARLDYLSIEAGNGAAGVTGDSKLPPIGTCTRGGVGGGGGYNTGQGSIWSSSCSAQPASAGDSVYVNGVTTPVAAGGAGGATGHTECSEATPHYSDLSNGARGGDGQKGVQGPAGLAAPTDPGQFTYTPGGDLVRVGNHGGRGGDGSAGAGGGGGAAGDNGDVSFWCLAFQPIRGGAGHNGGAGGCGGGGGGGGSSGGGAFALVVADTSVGSAGLVLFGGAGGPGGGGGSSAIGTSGVQDPSPGSTGESTGKICLAGPINAGTGGQGGYGGDGGGGGGGAGGNGGPSVQLAALADGALTMDANAPLRYAGGRAGTGGTGGTGVQDNNAGPPGNGGSSGDQMSIPLVYVAASASSSASGNPPAYAVDGNPNTVWNSGGYAPAWIELDLKHTVSLAKVRLMVAQDPTGPTTHQLYFGPSPAPTALIATLSGSTTDMQWLDVDVPGQPSGRYLRVTTTASPSWVAWREIVAVLQPPAQQLVSGRRD